MKALVLSGGKGTRLRPLTFTTAKQLIPIANKPVLGFVLDQVKKSNIKDTGIIIAPDTGDDVIDYVKNNNIWNFNLKFIPQEPLGLAHAVKTAQEFLGNDDFLMCLGDNVLGDDISKYVDRFQKEELDSLILLKEVDDPKSFGIAVLDDAGNIKKLVEKPKEPPSNLALVGVYIFSNKIHEAINKIKPSWRNELEITDAIQKLIELGYKVKADILKSWWIDTGKKDDILTANAQILDDYNVKNICGTLDNCIIEGRVIIQEGAKIKNSKIRGPSVVGKKTNVINSFIGPYSSIGNQCEIKDSVIEYSVIMDHTCIENIDRLDESLVGRNAKIIMKNKRKVFRVNIGDYSLVEL